MKKRSAFVCAALAAIMLTSGCGGSDNGKSESYSDSANGRNQPAAQAPSSVSPTPSPSPTVQPFTPVVDYKLSMIDAPKLGYTAEGHIQVAAPVAAKDYIGFAALGCGTATTDMLIPFKLSITNTATTAQPMSINMHLSYSYGKLMGRGLYAWTSYGTSTTYCTPVEKMYSGRQALMIGVKSNQAVAPGQSSSVYGFFGIKNYFAPSGEANELLSTMSAEMNNDSISPYYINQVVSGGPYVLVDSVLGDYSSKGAVGENYLFPLDGKADLPTVFKKSGEYSTMKRYNS